MMVATWMLTHGALTKWSVHLQVTGANRTFSFIMIEIVRVCRAMVTTSHPWHSRIECFADLLMDPDFEAARETFCRSNCHHFEVRMGSACLHLTTLLLEQLAQHQLCQLLELAAARRVMHAQCLLFACGPNRGVARKRPRFHKLSGP